MIPAPDGDAFRLVTDDGARVEVAVAWSWTQRQLEAALDGHVYTHVQRRQTNVPSECLFVRGLGYWHVTVRFAYAAPGEPLEAAHLQVGAGAWRRSEAVDRRLRGCYGEPVTLSERSAVWEVPGLRVEHQLFEGPREDLWDWVSFRPSR